MKYCLSVVLVFISVVSYAQQPFAIRQQDTTVASGTTIYLSIDSTRLFSNFIFCAQDTTTTRWTIWKKNIVTGKYQALFGDGYNRMNVAVAPDKRELLYVRYRPQNPGNMYYSRLDSAWVCTSDIDGRYERVLFPVPECNKNAIYDLDWSFDKTRILYALGNDQYPSLTRDGDIFEYEVATGKHANLTNDWQLWSKNCRYKTGGYDIAYSHFANFWDALPTDIFVQRAGLPRQQLTQPLNHQKGYKYCTLTDVYQDVVLYRRGLYFDNKLYAIKGGGQEHLLYATPGTGGVRLQDDLYAATDFYNNIHIFTARALIGTAKVSAIRSFAKDHAYNYALDCNTRLNWLGRLPATVRWSTGETSLAISRQVTATTTFTCIVTMNGLVYTDSITVTVKGPKPVIDRQCLTLHTPGKYVSYQWFKDGVAVPNATDTVYTPDGGGGFSVDAVDKKGRHGLSPAYTISGTVADSLRSYERLVEIAADPAHNTLNIKSPFTLNMVLRDRAGRLVDNQSNVTSVNLAAYPNGEYDLLLFNNDCVQLKSKKIIKRD